MCAEGAKLFKKQHTKLFEHLARFKCVAFGAHCVKLRSPFAARCLAHHMINSPIPLERVERRLGPHFVHALQCDGGSEHGDLRNVESHDFHVIPGQLCDISETTRRTVRFSLQSTVQNLPGPPPLSRPPTRKPFSMRSTRV